MEAMGAVRLKEVDEAQAVIVAIAKALSDSGEIVIAGGDEDSELVYYAVLSLGSIPPQCLVSVPHIQQFHAH